MFPMKTTDEIAPLDYWGNFALASGQENELEGAVMSLFYQSYAVAASTMPQEALNKSLAILLPEIGSINVSASFDTLPIIERCDCISFVKEFYSEFKGVKLYYPEFVWEHYKDYGLEKTEPQVGALVILRNHIAVISKDLGSEIEIVEKNQIPCKAGRRIILKDYEKIIGFLR